MIRSGKIKGWFVFSVFGIGLLVGPAHYFTSELELTPEGFKIKTWRKITFYRWDEVEEFAVIQVGANKMVGFNFTEKFQRALVLRSVSAGLSGREGALPDTYAMKAEDLTALMAELKIKNSSPA